MELVFTFYFHVGSRDGTPVARSVCFSQSHPGPGHRSYNKDILFSLYCNLSFSNNLGPLVLSHANYLLNILVWYLVQTDIHTL